MRRLAFRLAIATIAAIAPIWAQADDQQIAHAIASKLKEEKDAGNLKGFDIDLQVEDGQVWLKGFVSTTEQHTLAIDSARYAEGVRRVVNELKVRENNSESKNVQAGFQSRAKKIGQPKEIVEGDWASDDEQAELTPVLVETAKKAIRHAQPAADVTDDESSEVASQVIEEIQRLKKTGKLKKFGIDLEVDSGIVTLTGSVASTAQRKLVIDRVRRIEGVEKIIDELTISGTTKERRASAVPAELPSDHVHITPTATLVTERPSPASSSNNAMDIVQEIVQRLEQKKGEGVLRGFDVDVRCDNGSVLLTGTVPSADQQAAVLDVARRVPGVTQVVNNLAIAGIQIPAALASYPNGATIQVAPAQIVAGGNQVQFNQVPLAFAPARMAGHNGMVAAQPAIHSGSPVPMQTTGYGIAPARFDHPQMPGYAWPSYASHPNYAAVTYPKQYSATAWPYIGPFYPYPQVPLGWRKVSLEWDDGFWQLDFKDR